jgi:hypothetical protein
VALPLKEPPRPIHPGVGKSSPTLMENLRDSTGCFRVGARIKEIESAWSSRLRPGAGRNAPALSGATLDDSQKSSSWAMENASRHLEDRHCNFAYSALASFRIGMSGSASFHRAKKSWYAVRVLGVSGERVGAAQAEMASTIPRGSFRRSGSRVFRGVRGKTDYFRRMLKERFLGVITTLPSRASHPMAQSKMGPLLSTAFLSCASESSPCVLRAYQMAPAIWPMSSSIVIPILAKLSQLSPDD